MRSAPALVLTLAVLAGCWRGNSDQSIWRDWGLHIRDTSKSTSCAELESLVGDLPEHRLSVVVCNDVTYNADGEYWYCRFQELAQQYFLLYGWVERALQLCREDGAARQ